MSFQIRRAAHILNKGGLIAYPTEAVYGLGCLANFEHSIQRLLSLKQRPQEKGLILLASDPTQLSDYIEPLNNLNKKILNKIQASWPGPVTWLLPAKPTTSVLIRGRHSSVAVRISAHPVIRELCQRCNAPLISTSANLSGRHMSYSAFELRKQFGNQLDTILNAPLGNSDKPSVIRDALSDKIIRS